MELRRQYQGVGASRQASRNRRPLPAHRWIPLVGLMTLQAGTVIAAADTLTIDDCVRLALARSPAAQAAGFDVDAATWRVRAARAAYAPRLFAAGEYGRSQGFDEVVTNGGSTAALLTMEATLLDGGLRDAQF